MDGRSRRNEERCVTGDVAEAALLPLEIRGFGETNLNEWPTPSRVHPVFRMEGHRLRNVNELAKKPARRWQCGLVAPRDAQAIWSGSHIVRAGCRRAGGAEE